MTPERGGAAGRRALTDGDWRVLDRLPLFSGLARPTIDRLLARASVATRPRGHLLFQQGDPATAFFVVCGGWVKLYRATSDGGESVVHVFTRGESFAEAAMFAEGHYPVNATVAETARVVQIPAEPFLEVLARDPGVARNMLASMSRHMRQLVARIEQMQAHDTTQRVAAFLLSLVPEGEDGAVELRLPSDKALIAARLGMKPETLSRAFARLRPAGTRVDRDHVRIDDVGRLGALAQPD